MHKIDHTLNSLLEALAPMGIDPKAWPGVAVTSLTADSRQAAPGCMFVAVRGTVVDGHRFIAQAIAAGAASVVCEQAPEGDTGSTAIVVVPDSARALGLLASQWYGNPSRELTLVGVTGTNGKTTIATLLYEAARLRGERAGLLSTVVNHIDTRSVASTHTTPDPLELNRLLAEMVDAGCTFCAMEVSSHAAAQQRIAGLHWAGGIFTNLTRDHLDYHGTVAAYLEAKRSFFDALPAEAFALTNLDDRNGRIMVQNTKAHRYTYSLRSDADFRGAVVESHLDGMIMRFNGTEVATRFCGRFNASNLTAVYGAIVLLGVDPAEAAVTMSALVPVAGRFQPVRSDEGVTAIVDYAHTPDALANVLATIEEIVAGSDAQIITVVGAGGDRDAGKRPMMAAEAARRSHMVILTSDNPRTEDPVTIIEQMAAGLPSGATAEKVVDRREAIGRAVALAQPGDVILVAGKGHEDYQIIGTTKHHFDDREELIAAFESKKRH